MAPNVKQRKIALVGSRSVGTLYSLTSRSRLPGCMSAKTLLLGKSSLTVQYVEGHFVEPYYPTIENSFSKEITVKNQKFATEIVDTAGQVRWSIKARSPSIDLLQG